MEEVLTFTYAHFDAQNAHSVYISCLYVWEQFRSGFVPYDFFHSQIEACLNT